VCVGLSVVEVPGIEIESVNENSFAFVVDFVVVDFVATHVAVEDSYHDHAAAGYYAMAFLSGEERGWCSEVVGFAIDWDCAASVAVTVARMDFSCTAATENVTENCLTTLNEAVRNSAPLGYVHCAVVCCYLRSNS